MMKLCLIADDFEVIRKVARPIIEEIGYIVIEAENAAGVMAQCEQEMPHLIIVDWSLPDLDTHTLIKSIRSIGSSVMPGILYMVTENDQRDVDAAITAGADDYLMKPFDEHSLPAKIRELEQPRMASA